MIKIKLITALAFSVILNFCFGQESKKDTQQIIKTEKKINESTPSILSTDNSLFYSGVNNQISQVVRTIFQDSNGNLWFGTQNGAFKFDGNSLIHIDSIRDEVGKNVTIKSIAEDNDGKIWFGHQGGISSIDKKVVTNYYKSDGLISNDVWCITTDKNNNVWIGTIEGVSKFDGKKFTSFELPPGEIDTTKGISSKKMVHNIYEDSKGTLWFSSNAGLFSYANDSLLNISEKTGIQTNFINEIVEDKNGQLWVSTKNGLYNLVDGKAKNITKGKIETGKGIGSVAEDNDGKLWFVSNQHSLFTYNNEKIIEYKKTEDNKGPVVFQIFKDQENRLWFVGFGGAFRLENGNFVHITNNGPW